MAESKRFQYSLRTTLLLLASVPFAFGFCNLWDAAWKGSRDRSPASQLYLRAFGGFAFPLTTVINAKVSGRSILERLAGKEQVGAGILANFAFDHLSAAMWYLFGLWSLTQKCSRMWSNVFLVWLAYLTFCFALLYCVVGSGQFEWLLMGLLWPFGDIGLQQSFPANSALFCLQGLLFSVACVGVGSLIAQRFRLQSED